MNTPSYWLMQGPTIYLFKMGFNPYVAFIILVIIILTIYFLILYKGNFNLLIKDFKGLLPQQKRNLYIFIIGGLIMSLLLFYGTLEAGNRSSYVGNKMAALGAQLLSFLEDIGLLK